MEMRMDMQSNRIFGGFGCLDAPSAELRNTMTPYALMGKC